ncbi:MAG: hypothetical protein ISR48_09435 [Alphaproteobacteria bacterium]|nr:hypothetical protein [Alphaproteobacteria bacterium]
MAKRFSNERAENYLWENLPKIAGVIAKTKLLSDRCLMCDERMKKIREDAPEAVKSIVANANENDGRLCVVHKISGAGPRMKTTAGGSDFQTMTIAPLRGEKALKDKKPLNTYRKNILLILAKLPSISNDDELLEVITDLSTDPQKLRNYADAVMGAFKKVDDLHGRISEAESFFSRENMIGIMKWSDDLESHAGFDLKIQGKSVVIKSNNETCVVKMLS